MPQSARHEWATPPAFVVSGHPRGGPPAKGEFI